MPQVRPAIVIAFALGAVALSACSAPASSSSSSESVAQTHEDLTLACPTSLACCVSGSVALSSWDLTDPLQAQLAAWGCTKPRLYAPAQSANQWWYLSTCSDTSGKVAAFLANNPKYQKAPYLAYTATQLDPQCVQGAPQGSTYVLWDPTCSTCRVAN